VFGWVYLLLGAAVPPVEWHPAVSGHHPQPDRPPHKRQRHSVQCSRLPRIPLEEFLCIHPLLLDGNNLFDVYTVFVINLPALLEEDEEEEDDADCEVSALVSLV